MNHSQILPVHPTRCHPLTGQPLRAVMIRKDGRPVWPIIGAAPDDPPKDDNSPKDEPPKDEPPKDTPPKDEPPADDKTDWKAEARKWEERAKGNKTEADKAKTAQQSTLDTIAKALGLKDDETPDPTKLAGDLTAAQQEARETKVENAVLRAASKHSANPDALVDRRSFMTKLGALDPTAEDFTAKLDDAIKTAVEADPTLKTGPVVPPKSGAPVGGGGDGDGEKSVDDYVAQFNKTK